MATNKGPHDGDRNPNSGHLNSFAERYESAAFRQERNSLSLPPLSGRPTLPQPTNHPPLPRLSSLRTLPLSSDPLLPPLTNVTQSNTPPSHHERAISRTPTTNYGVDSYRQAFPMPIPQEVLTDVSSFYAKFHQQDMELQAQRTELQALFKCFIWMGHLVENLQGNIPIRTAPTASSEIAPGRSGPETISSLGAQRNAAIPSTSTAALSIHTSFVPSFHSHTPQRSSSHQQQTPFQAYQPAIQEDRGTSVSSGRYEHQGQRRGFKTASSNEKRHFREDDCVCGRSEVPNLEPARFASSQYRMEEWENGNSGSIQQLPAIMPPNRSRDGPSRPVASKSSAVRCSFEVNDSINSDNRTSRTAQHKVYSYRKLKVPEEEKAFIMILKIVGKQSWEDIEIQFEKRFPQSTHSNSRLKQIYYLTREEWGLSKVRGSDTAKDLDVVRRAVMRMNVPYLSGIMASCF